MDKDTTPLHERVEINKFFKKESRLGKLEPWMIPPAIISILFGLLFTKLIDGDYLTLVFMSVAPFFGWILCVGDNPQRYFSAMNDVPKWGRGRPKHKGFLSKTKAPNIRRLK